MKKSISILILLALVAGGVFAQGTTYGLGLLYDGSWNNGAKGSYSGYDIYGGIENNSFGGFFFIDATYVEIGLSFSFGSLDMTSKVSFQGTEASASEKFGDAGQFCISLLGKYPFELGRVTLFPLAGISYNMVTSFKNGNTKYSNPEVLNQFGVLSGIGADFFISGSLYLRVEGLFQLRFPSEYQGDIANILKEVYPPVDFKTTLGMGPVVKIALGSMIF